MFDKTCVEKAIDHFGSGVALGKKCEVDGKPTSKAVISKWKSQGYIPLKWHQRINDITNGLISIDTLGDEYVKAIRDKHSS